MLQAENLPLQRCKNMFVQYRPEKIRSSRFVVGAKKFNNQLLHFTRYTFKVNAALAWILCVVYTSGLVIRNADIAAFKTLVLNEKTAFQSCKNQLISCKLFSKHSNCTRHTAENTVTTQLLEYKKKNNLIWIILASFPVNTCTCCSMVALLTQCAPGGQLHAAPQGMKLSSRWTIAKMPHKVSVSLFSTYAQHR